MDAKVLGIAAIVIALGTANAGSQQLCKSPDEGFAKPPLLGEVKDQSRSLAFVWQSAVFSRLQGWWTIRNSVCNSGDQPLVFSWPKADLHTTAYLPLAPGGSVLNSFDVGELEPQSDSNSPVEYGLFRGKAPAHTYQVRPETKRVGSLNAVLSGRFVDEKNDVQEIELSVFSVPKSDGYEFVVIPKTEAARRLRVAISSSQNSRILASVRRFRPELVAKTFEVPFGKFQRADAFSPAFNTRTEFVVLPAIQDGLDKGLFVDTAPKSIELATIVIMTPELMPVMMGRAPIFKNE